MPSLCSAVEASGGQLAVSRVVCKQVHSMCACVCVYVCLRSKALGDYAMELKSEGGFSR